MKRPGEDVKPRFSKLRFPIILVAVMLFASNITIGHENICFVRIDDLSFLYLFVPLGVVILFNLLVGIKVIFQIVKMANGPSIHRDNLTKIKHGAIALVVLLPIIGLTWMFGFMTLLRRSALLFQYIFITLNFLQGIAIFVMFCLRNSEVRYAMGCPIIGDTWMTRVGKPPMHRGEMREKPSQSGQTSASRALLEIPDQTLAETNLSKQTS